MPAEIWQAQMDHFAIDHRVVAFDPRGQGRSEKVNYGYHVERRARDIGDLLARLGDEPAILVGWSLGAHEVLEYTRQAGTERVAGVIVVDHPILADWSKSAAFSTRYAEVQTNREDWIRAFVRRIFATPQSEQYLEAITAAALSTPPNATAVMISNLILMDTGDLTPAVKALDRPMLFVTAQNRPAQWTADVREHKPDAEVFAVADAGHALFVDRAMQFNEAVGDFIRRVTGR
jgi:pimeloyl-ACP methyl ester carboxylesterase